MDLCVFETVGINVISTVFGGLVLALILFWIKEKLYPLPKIAGHWYFEMHTEFTSLRTYRDMKLRYEAMIWCEGLSVHGTVEKIYENSSIGEKDYIGEERIRGTLQGHIEKNYLGKKRLDLHIVEAGEKRESTFFHHLSFASNDHMVGTFISTVAKQSGAVKWQRDSFESS